VSGIWHENWLAARHRAPLILPYDPPGQPLLGGFMDNDELAPGPRLHTCDGEGAPCEPCASIEAMTGEVMAAMDGRMARVVLSLPVLFLDETDPGPQAARIEAARRRAEERLGAMRQQLAEARADLEAAAHALVHPDEPGPPPLTGGPLMTRQEFEAGQPCGKHRIPAVDCRACTELAAARRDTLAPVVTGIGAAGPPAVAEREPWRPDGHITGCACETCRRCEQDWPLRELERETAELIAEPSGLPDTDLPGYWAAPRGACAVCHRGPLLKDNRCVYCYTLENGDWSQARRFRIRASLPEPVAFLLFLVTILRSGQDEDEMGSIMAIVALAAIAWIYVILAVTGALG
jgi:hypothetical protein